MRDGWKEISLEDLETSRVIKLGRGDVISKRDMEADPGPNPVYSSAENKNGMIGKYAKFMFDEELITWSVDGGGHIFYRPKHKFSVTNIGGWIRILDNKVFSYQFLTYVLQRLHKQHSFDWQHKAHPSVIRKLYTRIPLPTLPEQKRIVDLITSVDSYLGSLRTALASSVSARKSALESQLESFNESSPVLRLEELCASGKSAIVDGPFGANLKREDYLEEGIPVLKIQNIKQDFVVIKKMDFVSEDKYYELRRHSFQKNDILMTKLGDPLGLSAIVRELDKGLIVADLVRIRPDKIDVEFLCMQLNSAKIQNYINRMQKGSTRPRVNLGMIREMPIVVPSEREINKFVSVFGAWSEQNRKLEEAIYSTEQLRSGLLSDLLSGDHEIPLSYDKVMGAA